MTYDQEPTRWTASPEEAPELLRGAFAAGRSEGPSKTQMQALALKIAALSAGSAVAIGTAKAAAGSQVAVGAASWSFGKLMGVVILAGGIATGAVIWNRSPQPSARSVMPHAARAVAPVEAVNEAVGTVREEGAAPTEQAVDALNPSVTSLAASGSSIPGSVGSETPATASERDTAVDATQHRVAATQAARVAKAPDRRAPRRTDEAENREDDAQASAEGMVAAATEIELLRRAQLALRARPREAFQLTEQHRQLYPNGEFALERDALAIQALIRAGKPAMARDLTESFLKAHPDSPHAHRFREAMGIH